MHSSKVTATLLTVAGIALFGVASLIDTDIALDAGRTISVTSSPRASKGVGAMMRDAYTKSNGKNLRSRDDANRGSDASDNEYFRLHEDAVGKMRALEPNLSSEEGIVPSSPINRPRRNSTRI
jgi:hypothetical protein